MARGPAITGFLSVARVAPSLAWVAWACPHLHGLQALAAEAFAPSRCRIRANCERLAFSGQAEPLQMDADHTGVLLL